MGLDSSEEGRPPKPRGCGGRESDSSCLSRLFGAYLHAARFVLVQVESTEQSPLLDQQIGEPPFVLEGAGQFKPDVLESFAANFQLDDRIGVQAAVLVETRNVRCARRRSACALASAGGRSRLPNQYGGRGSEGSSFDPSPARTAANSRMFRVAFAHLWAEACVFLLTDRGSRRGGIELGRWSV